MTKQVWLIRHGKSARPFGVVDHDRPLSRRAGEDAALIRDWLNDEPRVFVPSSALRAVETAKLIAGDRPIRPRPDLYVASPSEFLYAIEYELHEGESLAFIGHNPTVTTLVNRLVGHPVADNVPTLGVAKFLCEERSWTLADYVTPKMLR